MDLSRKEYQLLKLINDNPTNAMEINSSKENIALALDLLDKGYVEEINGSEQELIFEITSSGKMALENQEYKNKGGKSGFDFTAEEFINNW